MAKSKVTEEDPPELKALIERLEKIRKYMVDLRKKGADVLMANLKLMPVEADIKYARASQEKKDYRKIAKILEEVKAELEEAKEELRKELAEERKHTDIS